WPRALRFEAARAQRSDPGLQSVWRHRHVAALLARELASFENRQAGMHYTSAREGRATHHQCAWQFCVLGQGKLSSLILNFLFSTEIFRGHAMKQLCAAVPPRAVRLVSRLLLRGAGASM